MGAISFFLKTIVAGITHRTLTSLSHDAHGNRMVVKDSVRKAPVNLGGMFFSCPPCLLMFLYSLTFFIGTMTVYPGFPCAGVPDLHRRKK